MNTSPDQCARAVRRASGRAGAIAAACVIAAGATLLGGCGSPSAANIALRKQADDLRNQIASLKSQHQEDLQQIAAAQAREHLTNVLPYSEIEKLNVPISLRVGRLTGGSDLDSGRNYDLGLKVYVAPLDKQGDPVKAAGTFVVEAFDLQRPGDQRIGQWTFDLQQTRNDWYSGLMLYTYVLPCPWQVTPTHDKITIVVRFTDELSHATLPSAQTVAMVKPPPPAVTQPAANQPAATEPAARAAAARNDASIHPKGRR
jgi:hypothetical protein